MIRVNLESANGIKEKCHVGLGQQHMRRSGGVYWYCSGRLRCTGDAVGVKGKKAGKEVVGQTTTGKESSNPFMAGVNTLRSDEDRLELMELMVFLKQKGGCNELGLSAARLSKFLLLGKFVIKRSGDVTRLQALVDKKKIVIFEDAIREIILLDDAKGVVCLPNEEIFAGLAQMGYEKPLTKLTFYKAF
nr:hypothetical protein [Tanacetum cinerariifolium]